MALDLRMKYFILFVTIIVIFSCAQSTYIAVEPWPKISYTGFNEGIDKLAGKGAIDWGHGGQALHLTKLGYGVRSEWHLLKRKHAEHPPIFEVYSTPAV